MRVASWNVNSIRVRLEQVLEWLDGEQPDVLGLQEIKMQTNNFPVDAFREVGYYCAVDGQKTYNGVALLSKVEAQDVHRGIPDLEDEQRRVIAGTFNGSRVINLYVPNGQSVGSEKYEYKLGWLKVLRAWLKDELAEHERLVVMGDFNIAPDDSDVHDPEEWAGKILCSDGEREALQALLALGLQDSFRLFDQPEATFSWWDYRTAGFRRNRGLRIDLLLVSNAIAKTCDASKIDKEPRMLERPSDHAPVWVSF
ncbi:MAG: exodeoxyribonuclease III [Chromatiales bacterium]|jgi:exodeoxyribonuclease-3|nr:exodeoxyribonuclease III [Chromatiales bacterium]MDP6150312.1 exodeoxyribonuclease III [Gammaproteobacteria bacterium]MDP7270933.1 exodeoxyribonuclease III [Gammaproteobacteria bacterium]HJP05102.1 exodeoxyribonuclease III [Gammaproteobacteria bacterium]